jgi:transcriptional regulator with XRE-family HTH domain
MTRHEPRQAEASASAQDVRDVIGANIKLAQEQAGIKTVDELARRVEISLRLVQKHRAGDNAPGHEYLTRYARVLGRPMGWFFESHDNGQAAA